MKKINTAKAIAHIRGRKYMSGTQRDQLRIKTTGEVFTPTPLVQEVLDQLPQEFFSDLSKTFIDPACGDGQFLGEVLIRKLENGISIEAALESIFGVDLMQDNVDLCRERLACGREDLLAITKRNIVAADGLEYHYRFGKNEALTEVVPSNILGY
jgi:type I restriction-modification system DNA methylase subunit